MIQTLAFAALAALVAMATCSGQNGDGGSPTGGTGGTNDGGSAGSAGANAGAGNVGGTAGRGGTGGSAGTSNDARPRWVGRVDTRDASAAGFGWQGSGLVAMVSGSSIAVKLRTTGEGAPTIFYQALVDGAAKRFEVPAGPDLTVTLATGLGAGDHTVELYRDTEGVYGIGTFLGFTSGTVRAAPASNGRLIEVIGDSISAGYGNLGSEPHPNWVANPACHWTAENSSWYQSYAEIAGRELNAEVSTIARSGWGVARDRENDATKTLGSIYDDALGAAATPDWNFGPKASLVVINLGTNDWVGGDPGAAYETAYKALLARVRTKYPCAWLFLTIGSMMAEPELGQVKKRLAAVVKSRTDAGDAKIHTFDFGTQNLGPDGSIPSGCDWHPSLAEHRRMAGILKTHIQAKLGW